MMKNNFTLRLLASIILLVGTLSMTAENVYILNSPNGKIKVEISTDEHFSFLKEGEQYTATLFTDGINADKNAEDYKKETSTLSSKSRLKIHLASRGGFALKLQLMPTSAENTATHHH